MAKAPIGPIRKTFAPWEDPTAKPLISFDRVTKRFGDFTAVDDLSLDIYGREFFSLLGPSGCGKTTLMRMLAGFETPTGGRILLDGEDIAGVPPYRRPVNMMFQSYALFPHMNVAENIAFGLKQEGMPKVEINHRVEEMIGLVKLNGFERRKPHQLSGGQRQRVALARSIAKRPKVLLLDEPLGALDKKLRESTQFELMDLQQDLGLTFLIVTHDQEEAMTVSDRIAVMDHGKLVQVATPSEMYEQPNSRYVADFVGDVNILEGQVEAVEGANVRVRCRGLASAAEIITDAAVQAGQQVWLAIRPEKLRIARDADLSPAEVPGSGTAPANSVGGEVWDIGYLGDVSVYHVRLKDGQTLKATVANVTRLNERPITWEEDVSLTWSPDAAVLLTS